ncbi:MULTISPECIES: hypothetical protein [unclassified Micromonospora]|uniref:hypothetical protein n=1 Tax=unclassified Micromonospora TaxID=2617518 RepID=UPI003319630A
MTKFVAALANASDVVSGDYCDVSVIESEIVSYREGRDGNDVPEYGLTDKLAMDAVDTNVRTDGDIKAALADADRVLRDNGWNRSGDWEPSQNAYYAEVERA